MTKFAAWLKGRGEPAYLYARRQHLSRPFVKLLAGTVMSNCPAETLNVASLRIVSQETGIPVAELVEDALATLEGDTNGKTTQDDRDRSGDRGGRRRQPSA